MENITYLQVINDKPSLIVLCGLQCSGKSTYANKLIENEGFVKFSSDDYRIKHPDWTNAQVFGQLYSDLNKALDLGLTCILDATSITIKARAQVFLNVKIPCYKIIHIFNTPYKTCLERLKQRNASDYPHKVPEEVLERYHHQFEIPFYEEGWDAIFMNNKPDYDNSEILLSTLLKMADGYNQQNKHHTQDLGKHMETVTEVTKDLKTRYIVTIAAKYHDVGKLFTQTIGEDGQAHYYDHANVGTYNLMCCCGQYYFWNGGWRYNNDLTLDWLFYINYHMHMHNIKTEKSIKKWTRIFGEEKFTQLKLLNQADNSNHVGGINGRE